MAIIIDKLEVSEDERKLISKKISRFMSAAHVLHTIAFDYFDSITILMDNNNLLVREIKRNTNALEFAINNYNRTFNKFVIDKKKKKKLLNDREILMRKLNYIFKLDEFEESDNFKDTNLTDINNGRKQDV